MCQISRKIHEKSFANSRAPQTLFRSAALLQTKKFQNNEYLLHQFKTQDSQCQLLSAEVRHVANSNIRTKAADNTLELSWIKLKVLKFTKIHRFHGNQRFSRKKANFTKNVTAVKLWMNLVPKYEVTETNQNLFCHTGLNLGSNHH